MREPVERVDEQDRVLGVVEREDAIRNRWPHRVATTICRDEAGRFLVYRRPDGASRFPGHHEVMFGGAVEVGESYEAAAVRELTEELGVTVPVRPCLTFLCAGAISPYWLGVHEAVFPAEAVAGISADPAEVAWYAWLTPAELAEAFRRWPFVPDGREAFDRYLAECGDGR
ncbi:NUDIX domain-containing protein [Streptomyces kaniharaensis]|uniref:NUDIX domain-containing protein n=1 Tax=Streptomyces kaniharaensis TaxID=212423 RepID=A0A6N7KXY0_9ACTN|nr:NUDIX domain-containing protein [Streptomyces kaniharaensis]MQS15645.1 NUDIX domain-containing protein [Streptomyces kaniharaensis]